MKYQDPHFPITSRKGKALPAGQTSLAVAPARPIAFYLPQFHPTPENDKWWGAGFTEWTNVTQAQQIFPGHYQPRVPGLLGYYDLRLRETIESQIALATRYGIYGFCIYYYWFSGRRVLSKPIDVFASIDTEFKFSLCWANESWSRRWDGSEHELLIRQEHDPEKDMHFIDDVLPYMKKKNYISVEGRKLLAIYRPKLLNRMADVIKHWRKRAREEGIELFIVGCETFEETNFERSGLDGSVEFPPHNTTTNAEEVPSLSAHERAPRIYDYQKYVADQVARPYKTYKCFPSVITGWDNSARRKQTPTIFVNSTPELYSTLLYDAINRVEAQKFAPEDKLVFINAWNEWGEGTYLEPDQRWGDKYLEATRQVVYGCSRSRQILAADIKNLKDVSEEALGALKAEIRSILLERDGLRKYAAMSNLNADFGPYAEIPEALRRLRSERGAYCNVDSCNQRELPAEGLPRTFVTLSGWLFDPRAKLKQERRLTCFALVEKESGNRYVWLRQLRMSERVDVAQAYANLDAPSAALSGFTAILDLAAVPAGIYDFYIGLVQAGAVLFACAMEDCIVN
jgi:hypothetical protein